jgi:citrate synthase
MSDGHHPADGHSPGGDDWLRTSVGATDADHIWIAGRDVTELMGSISLTELAFLLLVGRDPEPGERRLTDAVLVSLADHGITPSSLATRLTYTGAPEATQGAIAAGLLGAGSVFLGPAGDTAIFLAEAVRSHDLVADDPRIPSVAAELVAARRAEGLRMPGLGHPVHRAGDPRTARLYDIAAEEGLLGPHLGLLRAVADGHATASGKPLPINGAGAGGAALVDVGIPPEVVRAFVLIARTAGLVAHLAEEMQRPIAGRLWRETEARASGHAESPAR